MKKIWGVFKNIFGILASPVTLFTMVGFGVLIGIFGAIFGFNTLYDKIAMIWSIGGLIIIVPIFIVFMLFAWLINPVKWLLGVIRKKQTIKKGNHRSWKSVPHPIFFFSQKQKFKFTDSCWWFWNDPDRDGDWSKIIGFINGFKIHGESYRFGFRPNVARGFIDFCPYIYQNGKRLDIPTILTFHKDTEIELTVELVGEVVCFWVNKMLVHQINRVQKHTVGFSTDIYIGGGTKTGKDWTAPHDVVIYNM
jgi:hypothetical protein